MVAEVPASSIFLVSVCPVGWAAARMFLTEELETLHWQDSVGCCRENRDQLGKAYT